MNEQENLDISRVIGVIMENPQLIEQISGLVRQKSTTSPEQDKIAADEQNIESKVTPSEAKPVSAVPTYSSALPPHRGNRAQLLGALKPYVSKERAKAIDSVISIADILDMMKAR